MRQILPVFPRVVAALLLLVVLSGGIGARSVAGAAPVGANASVPAAPASFGYGVNFGNPAGWNNRTLATVTARAGANSARIKMPEYYYDRWGYYIDFSNGNMAAYEANGLANLTGYLIGPTAAHSNSPTGGNLDVYSPRNLYQPIWSSPGVVNPNNYWASFVYKTVSTYKGQVKIWEVWNEPDNTPNWQATQGAWWTSPPNPRDLPWWNDTIFAYIRLLRVTYEVTKSVDPGAFVATGGIAYESFLDAILRYTDNPNDGSITADYPVRGGAWFDAVSFHHYPQYATYDQEHQTWLRGTDSDAMATSFIARRNTLRIQLERHGYNGSTYPRKLWLSTETGVSSKPVGGYAGGSELQRNYLLKMPILSMANGVAQVDWFQLADTEADGAASNLYAHMGLYYDLRGQTVDTAPLKPSATAGKTFGAVLRGQSYDATATAALGLPASARGYVFRSPDGRKTYALWAATSGNSEAASATVQLSTGVSLVERRWDFGATGATRTLSPTGGRVTLALSGSPVFLTETSGSGTGPATPTPTPPPATSSPPSPTPTAAPTQEPGSAPGGELLANGGLESGLANWYVPSWFAGVASVDGAQTHSGSRSFRFQGKTSGPYTYQEVSASPGEQVSFSGWVNVPELNGTMSMEVDLVPRHQYNGDLGTVGLATITSLTSGWVQITGSATMPDRTASVRLRVRFPTLDGTAYLDDLSLWSGSGSGSSPTAAPSPTTPPATATPVPTAQPSPQPAATPTAIPTAQPTAAPSPAGELLTNGGFEGGLANWYIPSWFSGVAGVDGTRTYSGSRALRFQGKAGGPYLYQEVPASPGEQVSFSGWVNVPELNGNMSMEVDLVARHQNNWDLATIGLATITSPTSGWVKITGSATMPDRTASVRLRVRFPTLDGTAYLDDLSLWSGSGSGTSPTLAPSPTTPPATATPIATAQPTATATPVPSVAPAGELLANRGFEGGLANWYVPSWFASTASASGTLVHSGSRALQFQGNARGPYTYQEVAVSPGQRITFSGWMNVTERYGGFSAVVELVARTSSNGNLATFPIASTSSTTNGWVPINGSAVMPDRAAELRIWIRFPDLNGTVYFDDLSIRGE